MPTGTYELGPVVGTTVGNGSIAAAAWDVVVIMVIEAIADEVDGIIEEEQAGWRKPPQVHLGCRKPPHVGDAEDEEQGAWRKPPQVAAELEAEEAIVGATEALAAMDFSALSFALVLQISREICAVSKLNESVVVGCSPRGASY